jgi:urease accessory protein
MRRAIEVLPAGHWRDEDAVATVTLAWGDRHRRRLLLYDHAGEPFLLDLHRPAVLADGDGLGLAGGGGVIRVRAAVEELIEAKGASQAETTRLAWHIGNRHAPVQVLESGTLRVLADPVLAAMLRGLGARVESVRAPFSPEAGAYAVRPAENASAAAHDHATRHAHGH